MDNTVRESLFVATRKTLANDLYGEFCLIWLDPNCRKNEDNDDTEKRLRGIDSSLQVHSTIEESVNYIEEIHPQRVFIIISGSYGEIVIDRIDQIPPIVLVYIFCHDKLKNERWARNHEKIGNRIFNEKDDLFRQVEQDIQRCIRDILPISILHSNAKQKTFRDLRKEGALFIWFQLLIDKLIHLPHTATAKKELVDICRAQYHKQVDNFIQIFDEEYRSVDASRWYSRASFLYRLLNQGLRMENFDIIYKFRLFIADFHKQLLTLGCDDLKAKADENNILIVYRGQLLPMDELNSIRTNQSGYIAMNTFLSTSLSSAVAADFQGNGDQRPFLESVIFEIKIDFSTLTSPTVPFALISQMSTKPDEQEVVFSIGSVFRIDSIDDDIYPLWHIKLTLDSKQSTGLIELFDFYAPKTTLLPTSLLDLSEIFLLIDDYNRAENYNKILLEQIPENHSDVPKIYNNLANICRLRGNFTEAKNYLTLADETLCREVINNPTRCDICITQSLLYDNRREYKRAREKLFEASSLVQNDCIIRSQILKNIGATYQHEENYESSSYYYGEALKIQQKILPDKHPALADTYDSMAQIYSERLEFERAIELHRDVLAIQKKVLPPVHSAIARTFSNIALIYYNQDEVDAALDNYTMALEMLKQIYGSDYRGLGTIFTNIGDVYSKKLDDKNAESYYEMAFEIHQKYLPSSEIDLALTYKSMGNIRRDRHQFNEVVWYYDKALQILLLPAHKDENQKRAYTYNDYGQHYAMINDWKQAINYHTKSLDELEIVYGDNTCQSTIVMAHIRLGHTHKDADDLENAMKHYVKSFQLLTKLDATNSNQKQRSDRSAGHLARIIKDHYKAFLYYEKSANLSRLFDQPYKKCMMEIYVGIADVLIKQNRIDRAIEMYEKLMALEVVNPLCDEDLLAIRHYKIALLYFRTSDYTNALASFEYVLEKERQLLAPDFSKLADILFRKGVTLTYLKKYDEALSSHQESLEYRSSEQELALASSYDQISGLLARKKRYEDAVSYLIKSADIRQRAIATLESSESECDCSTESSVITTNMFDQSQPRKTSLFQLRKDLLVTQFNSAVLYQALEQDHIALCEYQKIFNFCIENPTMNPEIAAKTCKKISMINNRHSQT
ncbi:unnamed protein product [Rotaria sp. Silwood1]|nr:unnamed protein product [Rotaria sp. Silwood1]